VDGRVKPGHDVVDEYAHKDSHERRTVGVGGGGPGGEIRAEHLSEAIRNYVPPSLASLRPEDRVLRERVIELLREQGGNVTAVGRAMGKAPIQIRRWCRRLQIELAQFRS